MANYSNRYRRDSVSERSDYKSKRQTNLNLTVYRNCDSMSENKEKLVKKYERLLKKPDTKQSEVEEVEHELSEDVHETKEGLGI